MGLTITSINRTTVFFSIKTSYLCLQHLWLPLFLKAVPKREQVSRKKHSYVVPPNNGKFSQPQAHHPHRQVSCIPPRPYQGLETGVRTVYNISQLVLGPKFHQPKLPQDRLIDLSISLISSLILGVILVTIIPPTSQRRGTRQSLCAADTRKSLKMLYTSWNACWWEVVSTHPKNL